MEGKNQFLLCLILASSLLINIKTTEAAASTTARSSEGLTDLSFGIGLIDQYVGQIQTSSQGGTNSLDYRVFLTTDLTYSLNSTWHIIAEAGFLWPGGEDDELTSKKSYFINGLLGYRPMDELLIKAGSGFYMTTISGDGGTADLPNGLGVDSFPVPEGDSTSRNVTTNLGLSYFPALDYSINTEFIIFNLFNSRNRSLSYTLSFSYHFGDSLWND